MRFYAVDTGRYNLMVYLKRTYIVEVTLSHETLYCMDNWYSLLWLKSIIFVVMAIFLVLGVLFYISSVLRATYYSAPQNQKLYSYLGSFEIISDYMIADKHCEQYFSLLS